MSRQHSWHSVSRLTEFLPLASCRTLDELHTKILDRTSFLINYSEGPKENSSCNQKLLTFVFIIFTIAHFAGRWCAGPPHKFSKLSSPTSKMAPTKIIGLPT